MAARHRGRGIFLKLSCSSSETSASGVVGGEDRHPPLQQAAQGLAGELGEQQGRGSGGLEDGRFLGTGRRFLSRLDALHLAGRDRRGRRQLSLGQGGRFTE